MPPQKPTNDSAPKNRDDDGERRIDEEIEESFPASDPPSYAGGGTAVGEPKRPKESTPTS